MKKFFVVFALFCVMIFAVSCGGSGSSSKSASNGCSTYKEYECRGDASYFCGYAEDGSLKWYFHKACESGCDAAAGKCNPDSDGNDSGTPDTDKPDTTPEQPDENDPASDSSDSEPDNGDTDTSTPDDNTDSTPDEGDSQDDNGQHPTTTIRFLTTEIAEQMTMIPTQALQNRLKRKNVMLPAEAGMCLQIMRWKNVIKL